MPRPQGKRAKIKSRKSKKEERKTPQAIRGRIISKPDWIGGSEERDLRTLQQLG